MMDTSNTEGIMDTSRRFNTHERRFTCNICNTSYTKAAGLSRHKMVEHGNASYSCSVCGKIFKRMDLLRRHKIIHQKKNITHTSFTQSKKILKNKENQSIIGRGGVKNYTSQGVHERRFRCEICGTSYTKASNLSRHKQAEHSNISHKCNVCGKIFKRVDKLKRHKKIHQQNKIPTTQHQRNGGTSVLDNLKERDVDMFMNDSLNFTPDVYSTNRPHPQECAPPKHCESAFKNALAIHQIRPEENDEQKDLLSFLVSKKTDLEAILVTHLLKLKGLKWYMCTKVQVKKHRESGEEISCQPHFRSHCNLLLLQDDLSQQLNEAIEKIMKSLFEYQREGSGWSLDEIIHLEIRIAKYAPLKGSSYIELPKILESKKAIINVKNSDQKCFIWSILAALHPVKQNPSRVNHYLPNECNLNMKGIEFPVTLRDISKFECQNGISVNVLGWDKELYPLYITKSKLSTHVNLLLFSKGEVRHYCCIKDLNRLLFDQNKHKARMFYCDYCLHGFTREDLLVSHRDHCGLHGPQKIQLPTEDDKWLHYKDIAKELKVPFVIYADFEAFTVKTNFSTPSTSATVKYQKHEPSGFSYIVRSIDDQYNKPPVVYRGNNVAKVFIESLQKEEKLIQNVLSSTVEICMSDNDWEAYNEASECHICKKPLESDRVRDHCHITGAFRGAAHNECNLRYKLPNHIPVILHNLRGYDSHLIMQAMDKCRGRLGCIPNNVEKYLSFSIGSLRFIDSFQFLSTSLEKLVSNLSAHGTDKFINTKRYTDADKVNLLLRKGVYPYDYMDGPDCFAETKLPEKERFYSKLYEENISNDDYEHAQQVWKVFKIQDMGQYHDLYLKSDVLLLTDVFEHFRELSLQYYQLDPCHFYTAPGLAWQACLKMTGVDLELFTDPDMYLFMERGIRGGISMISNRHSKANNKYLDDFNPEEESKYILFLDKNSLYGWSMCRPLPTHDFRWLMPQEFENLEFTKISDDSDMGYILEVDLAYSEKLHDMHSDYPLAPERLKVSSDMLSPFSKDLLEKFEHKIGHVEKLVPNLRHKTNYIVHHQNLKLYLSLGMKLEKVHKVLSFRQSPWIKPYIDFNNEKRKNAKDDFEKDFFKLQINSVFGKTMENLRKHVNVKLTNTESQLRKYVASPSFESFKIFGENFAAICMRKTKLVLNKPIYTGMAILDLSKAHMFDFHYNHIQSKYGECAKLLMTDTDSLCYEIRTDDVYQDMLLDIDMYDTSNFPQDHFLYSVTNKKTLGLMKDEACGKPVKEFIGLKSKMYSLTLQDSSSEHEKKTAKGISRYVTKTMKHSQYKKCLLHKEEMMIKMNQIRSYDHQLYSITQHKLGLSPFDDKRFILENGHSTLAHGHYRIKITDTQ